MDIQKSFGEATDYLSNALRKSARDVTDALGITRPLMQGLRVEATAKPDVAEGLSAGFATYSKSAGPNPADLQMKTMKTLSEPKGVISKFEELMSGFKQPAPAGIVLKALESFGKPGSGIEQQGLKSLSNTLAQNLKPHLYDDAKLSPRELVLALANTGESLNSAKPEAGIVQAAKDSLERLNISDPKGALATGLAKAAVVTSVQMQPIYASSLLIDGMEKDTEAYKKGEIPPSFVANDKLKNPFGNGIN